ncbi:hypothetical protein TW74_22430 [Vibrio nigripulchritudo]|nr:hypothetical protein TW74_22430 [Vibrio nigripulchritudo]
MSPTGIAYADSVTGIDATSAVAKVTSDGRNVFYVYPKTQVNVTTSRTKFSHFDNRDNTLYINNNPKINTKLKEPSNVTIIENQSSQPMVIGNIEVLGKRSDILFVSPSGIVCDSCNFKNAGRVTLAAGSLSNNNQEITTKNGSITITGNGLTTVDADIIDLVSEVFVQQAPIDTFVKARKLSNGEYTLDSSGSYLAAQTHLRINVGDYLVEYPTLRSTWNGGTKNNVLSIDHNINAGSLYIHAPGNITLASSALPILNTKADISIVGSHKDKSVIPFGSIKLTSYGVITLLDSTIVSPSQVSLNSDNLYISPSSSDSFQKASIDADSISFAVGDNIYNGGLITTGDARISAKNFYNAGKPGEQEINMRAGGEIFASRDVLIQAEQSLINVNRGMVVGNNVYLAAGADIHNGHGQPWRCAPSALEVAKTASYYDNSNNVHYDQNEIQLGIGAEIIKADSCPDNRRQNWLTEEREAYIFGFNIAMDAPTIVNSNPRLDVFRDIGQFKSRTNRDHNSITEDDLAKIVHSHQVSISAENTLHIKADQELKNGSGSIEVLNGNLILDTKKFQNHRYYIEGRTDKQTVPWEQQLPITDETCKRKLEKLSQYHPGVNFTNLWDYLDVLVEETREEVGQFIAGELEREYTAYFESIRSGCEIYVKPYSAANVQAMMIKNENWLAANSPLPLVLVGKDLHVTSKAVNSFSNLAGNIEILGNLTGKIINFENLGLQLRKSNIEQIITEHKRTYCSKRILWMCVKSETKRWKTTKEEFVSAEDLENFPALLYLGDGTFTVEGVNPSVTDGIVKSGNITYGKF